MKIVWKFSLEPVKFQKIKMPKNSTILTIHGQRQSLCLWVLVENSKEVEDRFFAIVETGQPVPSNILRYIGSFQIEEENLVGHVFETKGEQIR